MAHPITSRQHPIVRRFREAAHGDAGLALIDGWHLLRDAVAAEMTVVLVAVSSEPPDAAAARALEALRGRDTTIVEVSRNVMDAISPVRAPTGAAALIERPAWPIARLLQPQPALIVIAIDMQDPGNVGALLRAAEAGGGTGVIFSGTSADVWGWKALRASMGSAFRLPTVRVEDPLQAFEACRAAGVRVIATPLRGGRDLHDADLRGPVAFVMGGEGAGLDRELIAAADERITIPMLDTVESLNVAVAAALLVYEAARQRRA